VAAFRAALEVSTRKDMPAQWAATQNNLGTALQTLGDRTREAEGLSALNEAVAAYRAALEVYTRRDMPSNWAMTQNNLGNALATLGDRTGTAEGLSALNEAATAYRAALEVRTRRHMPADWAFTVENIALVEEALAIATKDAQLLRRAVDTITSALEIFRAMKAAYNIEKAERNWSRMMALLAKVEAAERASRST
jgi:tetratricopeptide (TPR) repeat protein